MITKTSNYKKTNFIQTHFENSIPKKIYNNVLVLYPKQTINHIQVIHHFILFPFIFLFFYFFFYFQHNKNDINITRPNPIKIHSLLIGVTFFQFNSFSSYKKKKVFFLTKKVRTKKYFFVF